MKEDQDKDRRRRTKRKRGKETRVQTGVNGIEKDKKKVKIWQHKGELERKQ